MLLIDNIISPVSVDETLIQAIITLGLLYIGIYFILHKILSQIESLENKITRHEYSWEIFTRIVSLFNSLQCIGFVFSYVMPNFNDYLELNEVGHPDVIRGLYWFAAYLIVDGVFCLREFVKTPTIPNLTTVVHHFVGGFGIYLIAEQRRSLWLGSYFAWTEISTPLLHISWVLYTNKIDNKWSRGVFLSFYLVFGLARIATIPILIYYIDHNSLLIYQNPLLQWFMVYAGSGTLIILNSVWFIMLSLKAVKIFSSKNETIN